MTDQQIKALKKAIAPAVITDQPKQGRLF